MVNRWFGVGQFLSGAMGQLYPGGDNYDIAIQIDGDGQHDPKFIPYLIKRIEEGNHLCIGSRFIENEGFQSSKIR